LQDRYPKWRRSPFFSSDGVKESEMRRPFREQSKAKEHTAYSPNAPAGAAGGSPAQPAGECHPEQRDVNGLDLGDTAFLHDAGTCISDEDGSERRIHSKPWLASGEHHQAHGEHREHRGNAHSPLISRSERFDGAGDGPIDQGRLAKIRPAVESRDDPIAGLEHIDPRHDAAYLLALDFHGTEAGQIDRSPKGENDGVSGRAAEGGECFQTGAVLFTERDDVQLRPIGGHDGIHPGNDTGHHAIGIDFPMGAKQGELAADHQEGRAA